MNPTISSKIYPASYAFAFSLVPKVVENWREDLNSKNRPKLAARIANPSEQPDGFAEGWEDVLEAERSSKSGGALVDL
jgi:coatomer subunit beta'